MQVKEAPNPGFKTLELATSCSGLTGCNTLLESESLPGMLRQWSSSQTVSVFNETPGLSLSLDKGYCAVSLQKSCMRSTCSQCERPSGAISVPGGTSWIRGVKEDVESVRRFTAQLIND